LLRLEIFQIYVLLMQLGHRFNLVNLGFLIGFLGFTFTGLSYTSPYAT
jgi:hypothetical protein